jgi:hypothetical protein
VDHQVEHHVDIEAAGAEHAEAVNFEKQRQCGARGQGGDGGVESLQVPHLEDAPGARGGVCEPGGGGEVRGHGFFHQHVKPGLHELAAGFGVHRGGGGYDGCVGDSGQLADAGKGPRAGRGGRLPGARRIGIYHGGQHGARGLGNHAAVIAPELAGAHDSYTNLIQKSSRGQRFCARPYLDSKAKRHCVR